MSNARTLAGLVPDGLDSYEEGTLEGTLTPATSGTVTINTTGNTLRYTKIGGLVHITGRLGISSVSAPVGDYILGLPFTIASITEAGEIGGSSIAWYNESSGSLENGFLFTDGSGTSLRFRLGSALAAGDNVYMSYCYVTDS